MAEAGQFKVAAKQKQRLYRCLNLGVPRIFRVSNQGPSAISIIAQKADGTEFDETEIPPGSGIDIGTAGDLFVTANGADGAKGVYDVIG